MKNLPKTFHFFIQKPKYANDLYSPILVSSIAFAIWTALEAIESKVDKSQTNFLPYSV